ncbi:MAG TPA: hypothetical protein VMT66_09385 [Steroidobacteraceae bacterium]|nr:hypothetical protein [Steroidobacteraceae bacterium]
MKRLAELEVRRRTLLARCEAQRAELSVRLAELSPRRWTQALAGGLGSGAAAGAGPARHPLAWILAAAALFLLRRPREALTLLARARGTLSWVARAAEVVGLVGALRRRRRR